MQARIRIPAPTRLVLVVLIAFLLSTWIDPYLAVLHSSLAAQAVDAVLPVILVLLVWALSGRAWVALAVEIVALALLRYANAIKVTHLDTDIVYADFTILGGLLKDPHLVLGFVHPSVRKVIAVIVAALIVASIAWYMRRRRGAGWKLRVVVGGVAVIGLTLAATLAAPTMIPALKWQVYSQPNGAQQVGIAGNILLGRMTTGDVNRRPDPAAERAFWNDPLVRAAEQRLTATRSGVRPDIVILQSESLFMPSQLCGFSQTPLLKNVAAQQPDTLSSLHVPVFGGRTLETEFEVLTGTPLSFYPGAMFAYYQLVHHPFDALPRVLDGDGYATVAIHPNQRGFWNRGTVFPEMGFDTFQDINSFVSPADYSTRGLVRDSALVRAILAELDQSNRPTFVMAISIENHGPWGQFGPTDAVGLGLPPQLTGRARAEMADYVEHAIDFDRAYGFLLKALQRRKRPTVVVMYGDHMPALPKVYRKLCFKNDKTAEQHEPPYRIWANFPMPKPPATTSAYLLQGWLMHVAGLPMRGQVLADHLAGMVVHAPRVSAAGRKRVLDEYANIAAANVATTLPPVRGRKTVFFGGADALHALARKQNGADSGIALGDEGLRMQPHAGHPARIEFATDATVASLSLRPYLAGSTLRCLAGSSAARSEIDVQGDGRVLYRAYLTPQTFRLATLDLQGVKRLSITSASQNLDANGCAQVQVRVAQMLCYSAHCNTPGPLPKAGLPARQPPRILTDDPMPGDVAHLASMAPWRSPRATSRIANIEWLVQREVANQAGFGAFQVQPDAQLFMHPAVDHPAWIDFDVAGVDAMELTPRINPLDQGCLAMKLPDVAVVDLRLLLDGKPLEPQIVVDRAYHQTLELDVRSGETLRIQVAKAGATNACDWFSVGVPQLAGPAVPADLIAAQQYAVAAKVAAVTTAAAADVPGPRDLGPVAPGDVARNYPTAAEESTLQLNYPLFLAYGAQSARVTPFFPGTNGRPLSIRLGPNAAGYSLQAQGNGCAYPMDFEMRSPTDKLIAKGRYRGTRIHELAGWKTGGGTAILTISMARGAKDNFSCNLVVSRNPP